MRIGKIVTIAIMISASGPAFSQMVDVPIWSNGILGQQAMRHTYDNYNEKNGIDTDRAKPSRNCSADALPTSERRAMEAEYVRRQRADGKPSADAWVQEQGRRFRMKLVAEGICSPPPEKDKRSASATKSAGKKQPLNKQGKPCSRTRLEQRVTPGFGGEAMSMGMVLVCAD